MARGAALFDFDGDKKLALDSTGKVIGTFAGATVTFAGVTFDEDCRRCVGADFTPSAPGSCWDYRLEDSAAASAVVNQTFDLGDFRTGVAESPSNWKCLFDKQVCGLDVVIAPIAAIDADPEGEPDCDDPDFNSGTCFFRIIVGYNLTTKTLQVIAWAGRTSTVQVWRRLVFFGEVDVCGIDLSAIEIENELEVTDVCYDLTDRLPEQYRFPDDTAACIGYGGSVTVSLSCTPLETTDCAPDCDAHGKTCAGCLVAGDPPTHFSVAFTDIEGQEWHCTVPSPLIFSERAYVGPFDETFCLENLGFEGSGCSWFRVGPKGALDWDISYTDASAFSNANTIDGSLYCAAKYCDAHPDDCTLYSPEPTDYCVQVWLASHQDGSGDYSLVAWFSEPGTWGEYPSRVFFRARFAFDPCENTDPTIVANQITTESPTCGEGVSDAECRQYVARGGTATITPQTDIECDYFDEDCAGSEQPHKTCWEVWSATADCGGEWTTTFEYAACGRPPETVNEWITGTADGGCVGRYYRASTDEECGDVYECQRGADTENPPGDLPDCDCAVCPTDCASCCSAYVFTFSDAGGLSGTYTATQNQEGGGSCTWDFSTAAGIKCEDGIWKLKIYNPAVCDGCGQANWTAPIDGDCPPSDPGAWTRVDDTTGGDATIDSISTSGCSGPCYVKWTWMWDGAGWSAPSRTDFCAAPEEPLDTFICTGDNLGVYKWQGPYEPGDETTGDCPCPLIVAAGDDPWQYICSGYCYGKWEIDTVFVGGFWVWPEFPSLSFTVCLYEEPAADWMITPNGGGGCHAIYYRPLEPCSSGSCSDDSGGAPSGPSTEC